MVEETPKNISKCQISNFQLYIIEKTSYRFDEMIMMYALYETNTLSCTQNNEERTKAD
jgi:hypothetical protein